MLRVTDRLFYAFLKKKDGVKMLEDWGRSFFYVLLCCGYLLVCIEKKRIFYIVYINKDGLSFFFTSSLSLPLSLFLS